MLVQTRRVFAEMAIYSYQVNICSGRLLQPHFQSMVNSATKPDRALLNFCGAHFGYHRLKGFNFSWQMITLWLIIILSLLIVLQPGGPFMGGLTLPSHN